MDHDATKTSLLMFRLAADKTGAESTTITEEHPPIIIVAACRREATKSLVRSFSVLGSMFLYLSEIYVGHSVRQSW